MLEASRVRRGDTLRAVVREEGSGKVVHEQVFKWTRATVRLTEEAVAALLLDLLERARGQPQALIELLGGGRQAGQAHVDLADLQVDLGEVGLDVDRLQELKRIKPDIAPVLAALCISQK